MSKFKVGDVWVDRSYHQWIIKAVGYVQGVVPYPFPVVAYRKSDLRENVFTWEGRSQLQVESSDDLMCPLYSIIGSTSAPSSSSKPKCCDKEAVYVDNVPGKEYYYCRQCKNEVVEKAQNPTSLPDNPNNGPWWSGDMSQGDLAFIGTDVYVWDSVSGAMVPYGSDKDDKTSKFTDVSGVYEYKIGGSGASGNAGVPNGSTDDKK